MDFRHKKETSKEISLIADYTNAHYPLCDKSILTNLPAA